MLDLHPVRDLQEDSVARERSRTGLWAAAMVVGLIVVLGIVLVFATRGGTKAGKQTAAPRPTTAVSQPPSISPTPSAPLPTAVPTAAPTGVTWSLFQGVALPASRTDGPTRISGPVYAGYSHTPAGALIAATNLADRYLVTPGDGWRKVVEQQVLPGVGRDAYETERAKVTTDDPTGTYGQIAGFHFVTYSPEVAVVQLVSRFSNSGRLQVATVTTRWVDGDWKLELQPDGGSSPTVQSTSTLSGFTPWGGV